MSIYKRASGRYAVLMPPIGGGGKIKRTSLGTYATKREAEKAERDALTARERGIDVAPSKLTMRGLFDLFMRDGDARGLSGTTSYGYRAAWKRCAPIEALPVEKLRPAHLSELYANLARTGRDDGQPLSPRSIGHTHTLVKTLLRWAIRLELVFRNVADAVEPPKRARKSARPYERADADRLIQEAAGTRYESLIVLAFTTGLRRGELAGLKWADVNLEQHTATIRGSVAQVPGRVWFKSTKTDRVATIALSGMAIEALRTQRAQQAAEKLRAGGGYVDEGFVFAPELGGQPSPGSISQAVRRIAERAGLTMRGVHAMRHSAGSWMIRAGADVRTVAAVLRHSAASTTLNIYAHEMEGAQASAVDFLDRDLRKAECNRSATAAAGKKQKP